MKKIKFIMLGLFFVLGCFFLSAIPAKAELHESVLVEARTDFKTVDVPEPENPVLDVTYKFAGWFTDDACTEDSALTEEYAGETAYAKFVPADVLGVQSQVIAGTMYSSKKTNIRFVSTIDSLEYESVGFEFIINGVTRTSDPIKTVYSKLCAIGDKGEVLNYNPSEEFHAASKYFFTWTVYNVPNEAFGEGIQSRPYWVTWDGTKVYGDWETKTVNMGYIPDVTGADSDFLYDTTALTLEEYESSWLQGGCTDGTYFYKAFVYGEDDATIICKYDGDGNLIVQSGPLDLGHGSDITYNSKLNQLVVCHYSGTLATVDVSFLDTEYLAVQNTKDLNYNTYAIDYNALTDNYIIGYNAGGGVYKYAILNSDFSLISLPSVNSATDNLVPQGVASDDSYIYFLYHHNLSAECPEGCPYNSSVVIAIYDWDGNFVKVIELTADGNKLNWEPENISVINNEMYISCATGNGTAKTYKVKNLKTFEANIGSIYYKTLEDAVAAAHEDTTSETVEITVLDDVELTTTQDENGNNIVPLQIRRNIVLKNLSGKDVVITGNFTSPQLMRVYSSSLEISGTEDGSLTIDGTGRNKGAVLIRNDAGCTFTLGTNAAIINGSALTGTAGGLNNYGTANLYGDFTGNDANQGGAIYNQSSGIVNIYAGTYSGNTAVVNGDTKGDGGAIYNAGGQVNIIGGTFSSNQAATAGGAIYNAGGQVNITGGTFSSNQAVASYGGAIYSNSTLSIKNAEFTGNYATGNQGGAIFHNKGQIQMDGCTFTGNYTEKAHGGAVYVKNVSTSDETPSYIQNSFFYLNSAGGTGSSGGAIAFEGSTLSVIDCQFGGTDKAGKSLGNSAGNKGGAIYQTSGGTITVTSTTKQHVFANNTCVTASGGGALYSNKGYIYVTGYAFENNTANGEKNNWSVTTKEADADSGHVILENCLEYEAKIGDTLYDTLEEAVTAAHADTTSETVEITVLGNVELTTTGAVPLQIRRNIKLTNASGEDVVITGNFTSPQLIVVYEDGAATLEISGTEDGSITIDGTGRKGGASLIRNDAGCTFTLGTNAAIINGGATTGNAGGLNNSGTANLSGDFIGNDARIGGAIYNQSTGIVNIYAGTYSENTAVTYTDGDGNVTGGHGGAIYNDGGQLNITGGTFSENQAAKHGGAIYSKGTLRIANAEFIGNYSTGYRGGAIYQTAGQIQVEGCTFTGNYTTVDNGGAMYVASVTTSDDAPSYIQNSYFYQNSAGNGKSGGAIAFENVTLNITDCQFGGTDKAGKSLGNSAGHRGGAIYQTSGGTITVTSTTKQHVFANNICGTSNGGGALYSNKGTITVKGYIFENNKANAESNDYAENTNGKVILEDIPVYEAKIGTVYYSTLEDAVTAAHADTTSEAVEITVLDNVELTMTSGVVPLQINRNIVLKNLSGKDVVITGSLTSPQLIRVYSTLEISGTEDGSITIDGTGRKGGASLIRNDAGCTFTLGTNAAITNGGATSSGSGAGLNNYGIANLYGDFTGNDATNGGAIYNQSTGTVNIFEGTYSGNTATTSGGAIYNAGGQVNITGGTFGSNQAAKYGGAIYSTGTLEVANAEFTGNYTTSSHGGAIYHKTGQIQVDGCTFTGNYTGANHGGAIMIESVTTSESAPSYIQNSFFYQNTAKSSGGAIGFNVVTMSITDCQFGGTDDEGNSLGNTAGNKGGAIYLTGSGTITITSNTKQHVFANNTCATANGGGALCANAGTITVNGYIFENNKANEVSNNYAKNTNGTVTLTGCTEE